MTVNNIAGSVVIGLGLSLSLLACRPTIQLAAPDKPIVIDINIKIEQDVRVRVDREIDDLLRENEDLF